MHSTSRTLAVAVATASLLALAVGGGVGYAAGSLPKNSVGSAQVKNGAIKGKDLGNDAVTGDKVKDGSLVGADLGANSIKGAQIDESTLTLPSEPGSVTLMGTAFTPLLSSEGYGQALLASRNRLTDGYLVASVPIPADVTPTSVTFYVLDNGAGSVSVRSNSVDAAGLGFVPSAEATSTGQAMAAQALTVTPAVLAGSMLELQVQLPAGGSYAILGAKVSFQ